jgi:hypothetical protein
MNKIPQSLEDLERAIGCIVTLDGELKMQKAAICQSLFLLMHVTLDQIIFTKNFAIPIF